MKKLWMIFGIFSLGTLFAYSEPSPGLFGLSGEWLYMLNAVDQPYFILDGSASGEITGKNKANSQSWHTGYRVEGKYLFCNGEDDFVVRWTHFPRFSDGKTVSGSNLGTIFIPPVNGVYELNRTTHFTQAITLYYLDVLFGHKIVEHRTFSLILRGGAQYANIHFREDQTIPNNNGWRDLTSFSQAQGVGPAIGCEFIHTLCPPLGVVGRINTAMLACERDTGLKQPNGFVINYDATNEKYWRFIPMCNLRFGFNYLKSLNYKKVFGSRCGCKSLDFEAGYEFITYFNGVERLLYYTGDSTSDALSSCFNEMMNLTLHGPYVHAAITF